MYPAEGEHAVLAESVNELAGHAEDVRSLGGCDFVIGPEHNDSGAMGDIVEHRTHGCLDRHVAIQAVSQTLCVSSGDGVDRVKGGCECVKCHEIQGIRNCNTDNCVLATPVDEPALNSSQAAQTRRYAMLHNVMLCFITC